MQIVYSTRIDEDDLRELAHWIEIHLNSIQEHFEVELIPKHHFMTHYPGIIREAGAIKHLSMMRSEAKHKVLKNYAENSKCFINLTKTISERHQQHMCMAQNTYVDHISHAKKTKTVETQFIFDHAELSDAHNIQETDIFEVPWLKYISFDYRENIFVYSDRFLFQIKKNFKQSAEYYLFCIRFNFVEYEQFLNSIEIKNCEPVDFALIKFSSLEDKDNYEATRLKEKLFIILDTLNLKNIYASQ